ncbi:MAG: YaeQ family protein [Gemmatimonadaceae bacterium]
MAQTATIHTFDVQLADMDRGVYESLALRVARHPSETEEYLLTRVLAYCLEYTEGIAFSKGLAEPDEPAIVVRDLTGALRAWIEIGAPDAARLHRASKAAPRVALYTHKDPALIVRQLAGERIHRAEALEIHAMDRALLAELAGRLERRMAFDLSVTERHLYLAIGGETLEGVVERHAIPAA